MASKTIQEKLDLLPVQTGVYKFYDKDGTILYVGKALNLKARVSSYFRDTHSDRPHIIPMIPQIADIRVVETENEIESLVLESSLIKQHKPYYNILLKDDKSYAWLYINTKDDFPTVQIVRVLKKDDYNKGRLFGPYPSGSAVRRVFNYLRRLYPFCTCKSLTEERFYYNIKLCPGPNIGKITKEEYRKNIDEIIKFLSGKRKSQIRDLEVKMRESSINQEYEKAAELRDKIYDLKYLSQKIGYSYFEGEESYVNRRKQIFKNELDSIRIDSGLKNLRRIECYDISNISGKLAYGSMTVSIEGMKSSKDYRLFKIKSLDTPNDPAMLKEVLERRLKHINNDKNDESLNEKPDLILIDGAKSQLGIVSQYIPKDISVMGISKGKHLKRHGHKKQDEFWLVQDGEAFQIEISNPKILINLRDEAHRFAITNHRKLRKYYQKKSILDEIKGIGQVKKKALIAKFGSVKGIASSTLEQINEVIKNQKISEKLINELKTKFSQPADTKI